MTKRRGDSARARRMGVWVRPRGGVVGQRRQAVDRPARCGWCRGGFMTKRVRFLVNYCSPAHRQKAYRKRKAEALAMAPPQVPSAPDPRDVDIEAMVQEGYRLYAQWAPASPPRDRVSPP